MTAAHRRPTPLEPALDAIESAAVLDGAAKAIAARIRAVVKPGPLKDALSGTWFGHALHPALTDVVIGSFLSATLLDVLGGDDDGRARRRLIGVGIAAYGPTALTGGNDWADTEPADDGVRRAGLVHAGSNLAALSCYAASLAARRRGDEGRGKALALGGATVLLAGGYLGGHLTMARGVGPDQTVFDPGPSDWTPAADAAHLTEGGRVRTVVADTPVMLVRRGGTVYAIHDRCSHRGCSLSDGDVDGDEVVCACHGSRFALADGAVRHGPATGPQPAFETRERDGRIELRLAAGN